MSHLIFRSRRRLIFTIINSCMIHVIIIHLFFFIFSLTFYALLRVENGLLCIDGAGAQLTRCSVFSINAVSFDNFFFATLEAFRSHKCRAHPLCVYVTRSNIIQEKRVFLYMYRRIY